MDSNSKYATILSKFIQPGKLFIFSTTYCPYCVKVKKLFDNFGIKYDSVELDADSKLWNDNKFINYLNSHSKIKTYPKVYIGENCIGGYSEAYTLSQNMKLFSMLKKEGISFPDDDQINF